MISKALLPVACISLCAVIPLAVSTTFAAEIGTQVIPEERNFYSLFLETNDVRDYVLSDRIFDNCVLSLSDISVNFNSNAYSSCDIYFSDETKINLYIDYDSVGSQYSCDVTINNSTTYLYTSNDPGVYPDVAIYFNESSSLGSNITLSRIVFYGNGGNGLNDFTLDSNSSFTVNASSQFEMFNAFKFKFIPSTVRTVYMVDNNSYDSGYKAGYDLGYREGTFAVENNIADIKTQEYNRGYSNGVADERSQNRNAYENGYQNGNSDGYSAGYTAGKTDGESNLENEKALSYSEGFNEGLQSRNTFASIFLAIGDSMISLFNNFLDFEFLGFNFLDLFKGILTVAIIILIVKMIIGSSGGGGA